MTISFRSASNAVSGFGSPASVTVTKPAGTSTDDVLVALVLYSATPGTTTPPSGWTRRDYADNANGGRLEVYTKQAGSSEPASYTWQSNTGGYAAATVLAYVGAATTPDALEVTTRTSSSAAYTAPTVTATGAGDCVVSAWAENGSGDWTVPAGTTSRIAFNATLSMRAVDETAGPAGSVGGRTSTPDGSGVHFAATVALKVGNQPPNAPTLTAPTNGATIDRNSTNRFAWQFSDPDAGDSQSKFNLYYRLVGAPSWTTVTGTTPNAFYDMAAGNLVAGDYEWQVETYDAQGVLGARSGSSFFTAADAPSVPTITDPVNNATVSAETVDVTWSAPDQDAYQLQVLDGGLVEHDTGTVPSTARTAYGVPFPDTGTTRTIRVRVRHGGLWSSWYSITVQVSYTLPPTPIVGLAASGTALLVTVTNPAPGVGQPAVVENRVYVDDGLDDGETLRAVFPPGGSWTYWTPRSGLDYEGRVRVVAVGDNGTGASSA